MLFQEMGKIKRSWIMTSIIFMAVGIIMLISPERYVNMLIAMLGYILIIFATVMALDFIVSKKVLIKTGIILCTFKCLYHNFCSRL